MAKFKAGDEVTVRGTIVKALVPGELFVNIGGTVLRISEAEIATHTPKPREFKAGDKVTWGAGEVVLEFVAARDGYAIMWEPRRHFVDREPIERIRHADEAD